MIHTIQQRTVKYYTITYLLYGGHLLVLNIEPYFIEVTNCYEQLFLIVNFNKVCRIYILATQYPKKRILFRLIAKTHSSNIIQLDN